MTAPGTVNFRPSRGMRFETFPVMRFLHSGMAEITGDTLLVDALGVRKRFVGFDRILDSLPVDIDFRSP
ncbi:MAG: hypothetical protein OHK0028_23490 [Deltaproteobacteria bacterium]